MLAPANLVVTINSEYTNGVVMTIMLPGRVSNVIRLNS